MSQEFVSAPAMAEAACISRRAAMKALARCFKGESWRGEFLEVRRAHGRGGNRGFFYEVSLRSLSAALEGVLSEVEESALSCRPSVTWRPTARDQAAKAAERWAVIEEAVQYPARSPERRAAIAQAVADGANERNIRRWIKQYEEHGGFGLENRRPSNAGERRVSLSERFDAEFHARGYPADKLAEVARRMVVLRRKVWGSPVQRSGEPEVRRHLEHQLGKLCGELGLDMPEAALRLGRRWVLEARRYEIGDVQKFDAKRFADGAPHIVRDLTSDPPMKHLVADVKHLDVVLRRDDGSEAWPKLIAFQDRSTQRVFGYPLLLPPGESVRREHVIEAFIELACDPAWGFAQCIHLDNGTEFGCFEMIKSAFQLVNEEARKAIIYSIPYNARAKTVEGWFRRSDNYLFKLFPGYAGSERMNKKTHKAGRPTIPYPHSFDRFKEEVANGIAYINSRPIGGQWGGRSADQVFAEKVAALNWRPVLADPLIMDAAFSVRRTLTVDRGALKWKGVRFTQEVLWGIATGTELEVAISHRRGSPLLFRSPEGRWSYALPDQRRDPDDVEGARESGRRKRRYEKAARKLAEEAGKYDALAAVAEMAAKNKPAPLTALPDRLSGAGAVIELAAGALNARRELAALPTAQAAADRLRAEEDEYLERKWGNVF